MLTGKIKVIRGGENMYYLLTKSLGEENIETNENIKQQLQVFKTYGKRVKILTRDFDRFLDSRIQSLKIDNNDVINMFDFFQNTLNFKSLKITIHEVPEISPREYEIIPHGPNYQELRQGGRLIAHAQVMPATYGQVNYIQYFDEFGNPTATQNYDIRGFKTTEEYFHPNGSQAYTFWFDDKGNRKIILDYMNNPKQKVVPVDFHLEDYNGNDYEFESINEMFTFFLDEVIKNDQEANIVVNNPEELAAAVSLMKGKANISLKYQHLNNRKEIIQDLRIQQFNQIIVNTNQQKTILKNDTGYSQINYVPDMSLTNSQMHHNSLALSKRPGNQVVAIIDFNEKNTFESILLACQEVRKNISDATILLCSKPDPKVDLVEIFKKINSKNLQKIVNVAIDFQGIQKGIENSKIIMYLSKFAGTPTTLLNNFKQRIPAIATTQSDLAELIKKYQIGPVVENNYKDLSNIITEVLTNRNIQKQYMVDCKSTPNFLTN